MKPGYLILLLFISGYCRDTSAQDFFSQKSVSFILNHNRNIVNLTKNRNTELHFGLRKEIFPSGQKGYFGKPFGVYTPFGPMENLWAERSNFGFMSTRYVVDGFTFDDKWKICWLWSRYP